MLLHMGVSGGAVTVRYCGTIDARVSRGTKQGRSLMVVASRLGRHKENGVRSRRRRAQIRGAPTASHEAATRLAEISATDPAS
jgi:hypothetical protein